MAHPGKNGDKEVEHPKSMIELMSNTREAIEGYAEVTGLTFEQAASVLILNELRCLHYHEDVLLGNLQEAEKPT